MIAFWIAVVVGVAVAVAYVTLGVRAFLRVRRDVLALAESGQVAALDTEGLEDDGRTFTWKALGAVAGSTVVIALLGVNAVFWYVPAVLAVGSAIAVVSAFVIDGRSSAGVSEATGSSAGASEATGRSAGASEATGSSAA